VIGRAREVEGEKKDGSVVRIRLSISKITIKEEVFYCGLIEELEDKTGFVTSDDKGVRRIYAAHALPHTHCPLLTRSELVSCRSSCRTTERARPCSDTRAAS
jgi:hypothetical protein